MNSLARRRLGRTNFLVSEISLGTVELGLDYGIRPTGEDARPEEAQAARLLHHALDLRGTPRDHRDHDPDYNALSYSPVIDSIAAIHFSRVGLGPARRNASTVAIATGTPK